MKAPESPFVDALRGAEVGPEGDEHRPSPADDPDLQQFRVGRLITFTVAAIALVAVAILFFD